jgi:hypothetical protein
LSPKGKFWDRLEPALDLSKNVLDQAKRDLDNSLLRQGVGPMGFLPIGVPVRLNEVVIEMCNYYLLQVTTNTDAEKFIFSGVKVIAGRGERI